MMNSIRMVWVISRHYNTDERMVPLMELIAQEIAAKVSLVEIGRWFHHISGVLVHVHMKDAIHPPWDFLETGRSVRSYPAGKSLYCGAIHRGCHLGVLLTGPQYQSLRAAYTT